MFDDEIAIVLETSYIVQCSKEKKSPTLKVMSLLYKIKHLKTIFVIHQLDGIVMEKNVYHQALLAADRQSEKPQEINTLLGSELAPLNSLVSSIQLMHTLISDPAWLGLVKTLSCMVRYCMWTSI